jgi:autotransporter-associated beta strand protein
VGADVIANGTGRAGGAGLANSITGTSITYATGGNGGSVNGGSASNAAANTGNGGTGGGAASGSGGKGGSGIVVVRYSGSQVLSGGEVSQVNIDSVDYTVHQFKTVGTSTLDLHSATIAGAISGSGNINWNKTGKLTLSGNNSYTGSTTISSGTLEVQNTVATSSGITNNAALVFNSGSAQSYGNAIGGTGSLTKQGGGTLTLTGDNSYNGATTVSNGTLEISGSGDINQTSSLTVASGATFRYNSSTALTVGSITNNGAIQISGTGDIGVDLGLNSTNDILSPGNSPGVQNYTVSQTWSSMTYEWETNNFTGTTAGTHFDQITINGDLDLTGSTAGSYVLDLVSLTNLDAQGDVFNFAETSRSWDILTTSGTIGGFDLSYWTIDDSAFTSNPAWQGSWNLGVNGTNDALVLSYTAIPEPTAALLGSLGLLALLRRRR